MVIEVNPVAERKISKRYRINVSVSTKGQHTYDCTVEIEGAEFMDLVLAESDRLVKELDRRYPPAQM